MAKRTRTQIDLTESQMKGVEEMMSKTSVNSRSELIRNALIAYRTLIDAYSEGKTKVYVRNPDTQEELGIIFSEFQFVPKSSSDSRTRFARTKEH